MDLKDVKHIANLSKLELSDEELNGMKQHFEKILKYFHELQKLDLKDVEPCYHIREQSTPLRDDVVEKWDGLEDFLKGVPKREGTFVKVPQIVSEEG